MTQAKKLVEALNAIDSLRCEPQDYLTLDQYAAIESLYTVLKEEGFEIKYRVDSQTKRGWSYQIASQLTTI